MIIDKHPLPDDPMPMEAPPSYDTLGSSTSSRVYPAEKSRLQEPLASPSGSSPRSPPINYSGGLKSPALSESSSSGSTNDKGKGRAVAWLKFSESAQDRKSREIRTTILGLVRDVIQEHLSNSQAAVGILQSCADVCTANSISFSALIQEKSIENHTPMYWAIVKRLPDEHHDVEEHQGADLLSALLSHATPMNQSTVAELRAACLATSDQTLFQRLRQSPGFAPVSGVDQMLLGVSMLPDEVTVEELPGDAGGFAASFVIPHFIKRMTVAKEIELEFIARSRMWSLVFYVAPEPKRNVPHISQPVAGSWCIRLALIESSPPTYIDSLLTIIPAPPPKSSSPTPSSPKRLGFRRPSDTPPKQDDPALSIRLMSKDQLQAIKNGNYLGKSIIHALETSASGANLQYGNNQFIGPDEKLKVRFEARLEKPKIDSDCVIC